jgi:glycosyltransferase involved in cell wall biosynthesis
MKFIFVVDKENSALWNSAIVRARNIDGIVVAASSFVSLNSLINWLMKQKIENILFSWRKPLINLMDSRQLYYKLISTKKIFLLIPDYTGLRKDKFKTESHLLSMCHGHFVTNRELAKLYNELFPFDIPTRVLHDLPDFLKIDEVLESIPVKPSNYPKKVIWVGNSRWGARQGYKDHKGFYNFILPLIKIFENHHNCFELEIIDSATEPMSHLKTLESIRKSDFLLQTSASEGSGIPILEALAMETICLTTPVGVANEIFKDPSSVNLIDRNIAHIHERLHKLQSTSFDSILSGIYENYISSIIEDELNYSMFRSPVIYRSVVPNPINHMLWFLRYVKNRHKRSD